MSNQLASELDDLRIKDMAVEKKAHRDVAIMSGVFAITPSKLNSAPWVPSHCVVVQFFSEPVVRFDVEKANPVDVIASKDMDDGILLNDNSSFFAVYCLAHSCSVNVWIDVDSENGDADSMSSGNGEGNSKNANGFVQS